MHHSNDEPPPLPRRRTVDVTGSTSSPNNTSIPPMLPPRSHGNLCTSRPRSIVGSTGLNYIHMQFTSDGGPPPRGRTHTTYSELVREVSGDPAPADRVLGRSSSEDDLTANTQNLRISTHEQHLDNVDLLRMNILKNGGSHSNPDVTRDSVSPQPFGTDNSPPPLPVRNKPLPTSGSHDHTSASQEHISASHEHTSGSHEHNPFDQADPFESGKDVSDPSDFYQVPHNNSLMIANGDDDLPSEVQQPVSEAPDVQSSNRMISTTSTVPSGYEESALWVNVDDELEYQSPMIPYHDNYDVPTKLNPNDQHDDKVNNPNDQDDDEGEEYINPDVFGDHSNNDDMLVTTDEVEVILGVSGVASSDSKTINSPSVDEYSFPTELLGLSTSPSRATETIPPPRATETILPPRATETILPPRATERIVPPRDIHRDQQLTHSRPLPPIPLATHPSYAPRQEPPLPARTTCTAKANSLGRTVSAASPRQQPRYDRESWIMKYVQQGYSRDQVVRALAITQNDFNMASNILKEFVKMR